MIHVCYGLYDRDGRYSKFTGTSMFSMFENTNRAVTVHILHDNTLSAENRDKFSYIAGMYSQTVKFYNVENLCSDKIAEFRQMMPTIDKTNVSIATLYRLLMPQVFPDDIKKIIYLDADTIINIDIRELWQVELGDAPLAAVPEHLNDIDAKTAFVMCQQNFVMPENYFNAGVELVNLEVWRKSFEHIREGIIFVTKNTPCQYFDQDILNYCFSTQYFKLPVKFNRFIWSSRQKGDTAIQQKIYHYAAHALNLDNRDNFNRLWFKYFPISPWFNAATIGHLHEAIRQLYVEQKNFATQISALISGKTRTFFVQPNMVDAARQIFYVKPEEEIIAADSPESLQKLIDAMKKAGGAKVFFLLVGNYFAAAQPLLQVGFVEGRDFLNAMLFLSDANGLPLNSYSLVKLL